MATDQDSDDVSDQVEQLRMHRQDGQLHPEATVKKYLIVQAQSTRQAYRQMEESEKLDAVIRKNLEGLGYGE